MSFSLHLIFGTFVIFSLILHAEFNSVAPTPFHDENCHLEQVLYYCNGSYHKWNEVITTLPGLYFFTVATLKPLQWMFGLLEECSMVVLRTLSLLTGFGIFILVHRILTHKYPKVSKVKRALTSLNLAFFPMLYFYYFMYYTESLSMLLLLLMHYNYLNGFDHISAFYGAFAVLTRQTNIVWVFLHALMTVWDICEPDIESFKSTLMLLGGKALMKQSIEDVNCNNRKDITKIFPERCLFLLRSILQRCFVHLLIGLAFVTFVVLNDGIVVGDRANHQVCLNLAQFLYFGLYTGVFLFPIIVSRLKSTLDLMTSQATLSALTILTAFAIVHWKTMMHWYLLTDNRHYIHYVGSALYVWYPTLKYALVPLYVISWFWIFANLELRNAAKLFLIISIAVSVIPQLLMEFRYFVPGFVYIRLHLNAFQWKDIAGEFLLYAVINYLTFYQFLYQPWETSSGVQRIMW